MPARAIVEALRKLLRHDAPMLVASTAGAEPFLPWRTIEGEREAPTTDVALEVLVRGVFEKRRFLDLIRSFTVFEAGDDGTVAKKITGYPQFHAVQTALGATLRATAPDGSRKVGVVWHTQGSGKSLTMVSYAGRIIRALGNPTIVVLTDRNDLDDQLFGTFARCEDLLRQTPKQVENRDDLPYTNVAAELVRKLLEEEIKVKEGETCLLELHGQGSSRTDRILSRKEYDTHYGPRGAVDMSRSLPRILAHVLQNMTLFFMGRSLVSDRTMEVFKAAMKSESRDGETLPRHYALLADPGSNKRGGRRTELSEYNIFSIFYRYKEPTDHSAAVSAVLTSIQAHLED